MSYPNYAEIAEKLDIPRCRGIRNTGQLCREYNHRRGQVGDGFVHWADRARIERAGVRRFLKLAAFLRMPEEKRSWARLYDAQALINAWGSIIGIDFPGHLSEGDKLRVRAMLINVPSDEPLREKAMQWAQK